MLRVIPSITYREPRDDPSTHSASCRASRAGGRRMTVRPAPGQPTAGRGMKVAVVVQRYGQAINGGAELHARYIAERLARHADVEVLTTCATDYITWRNELPAGEETVHGVAVRRFPVSRPRN